jgi:2'-5' RNA ligase
MDFAWTREGSNEWFDQQYKALLSERGFRRHANKLKTLAEKARQKILSRPDVAKFIEQEAEKEIAFYRDWNNLMYGRIPEQNPVNKMKTQDWAIKYNETKERITDRLTGIFVNMPDEAFKIFPWVLTQVKRQSFDNATNTPADLEVDLPPQSWLYTKPLSDIRHFTDVAGQIGRTLHEERLNNRPTPDINQMSFEQAETWARNLAASRLENGWEQPEHVLTFPDGWTVDKVTTEHDLKREGELMGHCVGGYCHLVQDGSTEIYSLRKPNGDPSVTIEIQPEKGYGQSPPYGEYHVIQVHGKGNTDPKPEYKDKVAQFFKHFQQTNGVDLYWDGSGQMDGYGGGELSVRDLEDLEDWWTHYTSNYSNDEVGPYGLRPLEGDPNTYYDDTRVIEQALDTQISESNTHTNLSLSELGKAIFTAEWLFDGSDPGKTAEWMRDKLDEWRENMLMQGDWSYTNQMAAERLDESHGQNHYIDHTFEYMVPHEELKEYGDKMIEAYGEEPDWGGEHNPEDYGFDPNTADNRHYNLYENEHMEHRHAIEAEEEEYYYGDCWKLVGYIDWLARLFPFQKGGKPPHPDAMPGIYRMPKREEEMNPWEKDPKNVLAPPAGEWYKAEPINFDPEGRWTQVPEGSQPLARVASITPQDFENLEPGDVIQTNLGPAKLLQKAHTPLGWILRCRTTGQDDVDFMEHEIMSMEPVGAVLATAVPSLDWLKPGALVTLKSAPVIRREYVSPEFWEQMSERVGNRVLQVDGVLNPTTDHHGNPVHYIDLIDPATGGKFQMYDAYWFDPVDAPDTADALTDSPWQMEQLVRNAGIVPLDNGNLGWEDEPSEGYKSGDRLSVDGFDGKPVGSTIFMVWPAKVILEMDNGTMIEINRQEFEEALASGFYTHVPGTPPFQSDDWKQAQPGEHEDMVRNAAEHVFREGDRVTGQDGRTGIVEALWGDGTAVFVHWDGDHGTQLMRGTTLRHEKGGPEIHSPFAEDTSEDSWTLVRNADTREDVTELGGLHVGDTVRTLHDDYEGRIVAIDGADLKHTFSITYDPDDSSAVVNVSRDEIYARWNPFINDWEDVSFHVPSAPPVNPKDWTNIPDSAEDSWQLVHNAKTCRVLPPGTPTRKGFCHHNCEHRADQRVGSWVMLAAKVDDLAAKKREQIWDKAQAYVGKLDPGDALTTATDRLLILQRLIGSREGKLQTLPNETFKLWDWLYREVMRGNVPNLSQVAHARDIVTQAANWQAWAKKYNSRKPEHNPNYMAKDFDLAAMEKWVYAMNSEGLDGDPNAPQWEDSKTVHTFENGWRIDQIGPNDCKLEGDLMGHCIGGYTRKAEAGELYSLRDKRGIPKVSMEVEKNGRNEEYWNFLQVQGKSNDTPKPEYQALIDEWWDELRNQGIQVKHNPCQEYEYEWRPAGDYMIAGYEDVIKYARMMEDDETAFAKWIPGEHEPNEVDDELCVEWYNGGLSLAMSGYSLPGEAGLLAEFFELLPQLSPEEIELFVKGLFIAVHHEDQQNDTHSYYRGMASEPDKEMSDQLYQFAKQAAEDAQHKRYAIQDRRLTAPDQIINPGWNAEGIQDPNRYDPDIEAIVREFWELAQMDPPVVVHCERNAWDYMDSTVSEFLAKVHISPGSNPVQTQMTNERWDAYRYNQEAGESEHVDAYGNPIEPGQWFIAPDRYQNMPGKWSPMVPLRNSKVASVEDEFMSQFVARGDKPMEAFLNTINALLETGMDKGEAMRRARGAFQTHNDRSYGKDQPNMLEPTNRANPEGVSFNTLPPAWTRKLEQMPKRVGAHTPDLDEQTLERLDAAVQAQVPGSWGDGTSWDDQDTHVEDYGTGEYSRYSWHLTSDPDGNPAIRGIKEIWEQCDDPRCDSAGDCSVCSEAAGYYEAYWTVEEVLAGEARLYDFAGAAFESNDQPEPDPDNSSSGMTPPVDGWRQVKDTPEQVQNLVTHGSWKQADWDLGEDWDTDAVENFIDNDYDSYTQSRRLIEDGASLEDFITWGQQPLLRASQEAAEWMDDPEADLNDYVVNPEKVNWQRIYDGIKAELEEEQRFREQEAAKGPQALPGADLDDDHNPAAWQAGDIIESRRGGRLLVVEPMKVVDGYPRTNLRHLAPGEKYDGQDCSLHPAALVNTYGYRRVDRATAPDAPPSEWKPIDTEDTPEQIETLLRNAGIEDDIREQIEERAYNLNAEQQFQQTGLTPDQRFNERAIEEENLPNKGERVIVTAPSGREFEATMYGSSYEPYTGGGSTRVWIQDEDGDIRGFLVGDRWQVRPATQIGQPFTQESPEQMEGLVRHAQADLSGAMVAFYLPPEVASQLAVPGGEPPDRMHITLAYFEDAANDRQDWDRAYDVVEQVASATSPMSGTVGKHGQFENETETIHWAGVDVAGINDLHEKLVLALEAAGFPISQQYDFKPHITLAYVPKGQPLNKDEVELPVTFDRLNLTIAQRKYDISMGQPAPIPAVPQAVA